jgi:hypothetical protein
LIHGADDDRVGAPDTGFLGGRQAGTDLVEEGAVEWNGRVPEPKTTEQLVQAEPVALLDLLVQRPVDACVSSLLEERIVGARREGGRVAERSGVVDIGLEGKILASAFASAAVEYAMPHPAAPLAHRRHLARDVRSRPGQLPVRLCDVREMWFALHAQSNPMLFQTGSFVESLLSQTLVVHVIRTDRVPFLQSRPSRAVLETTAAI